LHAVDFYNIKVSLVTHGIVLIKGEPVWTGLVLKKTPVGIT